MTDSVTIAAAFLLLTSAATTGAPQHIAPIDCLLPPPPGHPVSGQMTPHQLAHERAKPANHITVRWKGWHHRHHRGRHHHR